MNENIVNTDENKGTNEPVNTSTDKLTRQLATRVKVVDWNWYAVFAKDYKVQHEAFTALLAGYNNNKTETPAIVNTPPPANPLNENQFIYEFTPQLKERLTALRRYLKQKGRIPPEMTEIEFLQMFTGHCLQFYIDKNYTFINR